MTVIDFIGNVGGLFGLCLGFSLISFFELLYWFLIRTSRRSIARQLFFTAKVSEFLFVQLEEFKTRKAKT